MKSFPMKPLRPLAVFAILFAASCERKSIVIRNDAETDEAAKTPAASFVLPEEISFNEHIQPILSEYCYHCHGPDAGTRKPEKEPLRLDIEADAFAMRDAGAPVIIKGKPEESELVRLIRLKPGDAEVMPPKESHKTMGQREVAMLEKWIEQGAEYEGHWSYEPIARPEIPKNDWSEKPIDAFIFEKLAQAGLKPNPDDDPRRFHRRLSLDLTGLPPEPAQTDAFVAAYEKDAEAAVSTEADRLLATIQSAEHFARPWLDAARYADSHGIHIDNYRAIWPYRDWVVRAFHDNMKWDRFTIEQLAGDLLPDRTLDQHVATGFLRSLATTGEGGAIAEEYEAIYASDRVDTMAGTWLGLTASCASCHDHKFDPFSSKEFYQFTAFFRNNTTSALDGNNAEHAPVVFVPLPEDRAEFAKVQEEMKKRDAAIAQRRKDGQADFNAWLASASETKTIENDPTLAIHLPLTEPEGKIRGIVDGQPREWPAAPRRIDGPLGKAIDLGGQNIPLGDIGNFARTDQVSFGAMVRIEGQRIRQVNGTVLAKMSPSEGFRGWDLFFEEGKIGAHVIDTWDKSASKSVTNQPLKANTWHHVMFVFDGTVGGHQATAIFIDGKRVPATTYPNSAGGRLETSVPLRLGSREGGDSKLVGQVGLQDFRFYRKKLNPQEISHLANGTKISEWLALPADKRTPEATAGLAEHYFNSVDTASLELIAKKSELEAQDIELKKRGSASLVYEEKKDKKPSARILVRGAYASKGDEVFPETPAMLPPMPEGAPKNRLGLAQWLNDPKNPLPARVTMNRLWANFFAAHIVDTPGDFGIMGARPSHPKLLDWLASEFISSGWDYRHMAKLIATSRAYRQSGEISPEKLEKDPVNTLVSRGPRSRLGAEQLRDLSLAAAGALSAKVGGAPVKPYQPEGIWEAVAMPQSNTKNYKQDSGEALYRRSLYTFWKRSAVPATMEILDAPTREHSCLKRERTNTPLQALALMNDPQFVEANRILATKAITEQKDFDSRLDLITQRLLSRKMDASERGIVKETLDAALAHYTAEPEEARLALTTGETKAPDNLPAPELAAWSLVTNQLFNLDETLTR